MQPTPELAAALFRDRVRRARAMSPEDKLLAGPQLFEYACRIAKDGIRFQHPEADEDEVRRILRKRLKLQERLEERELENRRSDTERCQRPVC